MSEVRYSLRGLNRFPKNSFVAHIYDGDKWVGKVSRNQPRKPGEHMPIALDLNSAQYVADFDAWCGSNSREEAIEALLTNAGWSQK